MQALTSRASRGSAAKRRPRGTHRRQAWRVLRGCAASSRLSRTRISVRLSRGDSGAEARAAPGVQSVTARYGGNAALHCQDLAVHGWRMAVARVTALHSLKAGEERDARLRTPRRARALTQHVVRVGCGARAHLGAACDAPARQHGGNVQHRLAGYWYPLPPWLRAISAALGRSTAGAARQAYSSARGACARLAVGSSGAGELRVAPPVAGDAPPLIDNALSCDGDCGAPAAERAALGGDGSIAAAALRCL